MIKGKKLIAATVTIYDQNNQINDLAMDTLFQKVIREGADGLFVGGSVGECFLLTPKERIHTFELASRYMDQTEVYAHIGSISTDQAIEMTKAACACGISSIASTPPFYFAFSAKEIAHYFYDLAEAAGRPVLYYDIPSSTHRNIMTDDPEICALLKSGAVRSIKYTNPLTDKINEINAINPDIKIMGGLETCMISMLEHNCDGFIGSMFNFMLPQYQKIIESYILSDKEHLDQYFANCTSICDMLLKVGLPASIKYILTKQGIDAGGVRRPLLGLDAETKRQVDRILEKCMNSE